jgi:hypothetical protein
VLHPGCQLKNLLQLVQRGSWPKVRVGRDDDLGILFLGDSIDGYFVADTCIKYMDGGRRAPEPA